ncbi:MAG: pyridoxine 5'-phosphate synthase [Rhodospirillales bacterium]|nr:pyridoxine 5'-phosphate synthase [Rhodospirillales bacterium]
MTELYNTKLSVNLNKVALLRNQRDIGYPGVLEMARTVIEAGAQGITVHPRPDERHTRRSDVYELAAMLRAEYPDSGPGGGVEFNIEGNPTPDFLALVIEVKPDQVTLVPDDPHAKTSDHGWDIAANKDFLTRVVGELKAAGLRVSLFVDCEPEAVALAAEVGADRVELYTEPYAAAHGTAAEDREFRRCLAAGEAARAHGLGLNAGHDLNLDNLPRLAAGIPWLLEVSIGHAITADALRMGFPAAVEEYRAALTVAPAEQRRARPAAQFQEGARA